MDIKNVLAITLLKVAVNRTSPKALRERLGEEWQAHLDALPDGLPKLSAAAGFFWSTFRQENEKIRLVFLIHCEAIFLLFFMCSLKKIAYLPTMSACGIVVGVLGTLMIYWAPIATIKNLEYIDDEISYLGNGRKLSHEAIYCIGFFVVLGAIQAYSYSYLFSQGLVHNALGLPPALAIGLVCIAFACPPSGMYVLAKMERRQFSRWHKKLEGLRDSQEEARYAEIRRIITLTGSVAVCLGLIAQLPTTLF
jgi:hypothetical protein